MEKTKDKVIAKSVLLNINGKEKFFLMTNNFATVQRALKKVFGIPLKMQDFYQLTNFDEEIINEMKKNDALYAINKRSGKVYYYKENICRYPYLTNYKYKFKMSVTEENAAIARIKSEPNGKKFYYALLRAFSKTHSMKDFFSVFKLCWALVNELGIKVKVLRYAKFINTNTVDNSFFSELEFSIQDFIKDGHKISEIYKNAKMTKQTFSRIQSVKISHPSFESVMQLAIGLKMGDDKAIKLADSLGYTKELSSDACRIVLKHLEMKDYDIEAINKELFEKCGIKLGEKSKK